MITKVSICRWWHVTRWRLRYVLLDTPAGRHLCIAAAVMSAAFGAWQFFAAMRASAADEPIQAFWVQVVLFVVSVLISYALTPKQPDAADQVVEAPRVKDGGGVRMVFGEVWITDPDIIGWRKMGTKTIRGKKSGFNGRPIIGYWYKQLFHFLLCRGPVDAVLEFRGGDKTAWQGELTASGEVQINQRELWGGQGTGGEGGIEGPMEFLFGDATQPSSSYLTSNLDPKQPAYRGLLTAIYKGGLWGAFSPYPKAASFKVRRILEGWEREGGAWYPEVAVVPVGGGRSGGIYDFAGTGAHQTPGHNESEARIVVAEGEFLVVSVVTGVYKAFSLWATDGEVPPGRKPWRCALYVSKDSGVPVAYNSEEFDTPDEAFKATQSDPIVLTEPGEYAIYLTDGDLEAYNNRGGLSFVVMGARSFAMNPAHMIYQSITDSWMGAEPEAGINDTSLRASADTLYAEGFGLCTEWDSTSESVEQFQQRICDVIGASLSRSPVDGLWNLDLIRGGYDFNTLPVLTDDDIIEYSEQPGTMQDAVNQVIVEWRDPQLREDRSTAPVQSLGAIQAVGAVVAEVATYREIPEESLALRVAGRNLQSKARPLRRISMKTTRIAHAWRPGQVFRLQSAKRGIADMALRIGDADRGTLRSGAISLTLLQDVFGLPQVVYVSPDLSPAPDGEAPKPVVASAVQEVPYALLAALQPPGELAALPTDSGYVFAVATPADEELDYSLQIDAGAGYAEQAESDWSVTATNVATVGKLETVIGITAARGLDDAVIGAMVLWGGEICRLDAVDLISGTVTLGRGCADTVSAEHAAGERLWVIDDSIAVDATRYIAGAAIAAKLLPRTPSQRVELSAATANNITFSSRAARPYAPAGVTLNGATAPAEVFETAGVAWLHRDRIASAEQLVDQLAASIGPEAGTTYTVRWFLGGALDHAVAGMIGTTASHAPAADGLLRVEVEAVRDGLTSWQMQVIECDYRTTPYSDYVDEVGDVYADQNGDTYLG